MAEILSALGLLVVFILVLALAYFTTKWVGKRYGGGQAGVRTGNIKVVDKAVLGPDRMLCIVEAAGKTMLLGVTQQHIEKLCDIDPEMLTTQPEVKPSAFAVTLKDVLKKNWGVGGGASPSRGSSPDGESFPDGASGPNKPDKEEEPHA